MNFAKDEFYHVYNRGNQKNPIFFNEQNYHYFLKKICNQIVPVADLLAYCLMPNHFHLLIHTNEASIRERISFGGKAMQELSYRIGVLQSSYTQAINLQNKTTGSLFQQKTKSKLLLVEEAGKATNYLGNCFFYIHQNPLNERLVVNLNDWQYSSYHEYIGTKNEMICKQSVFFKYCDLTIADIIGRSTEQLSEELIKKIE